jgi:cyclophilin family peptidyl-prolyl cis-trans isomerase
MKTSVMKWLSVFLLAAVCAGFASCSSNDDPPTPTPPYVIPGGDETANKTFSLVGGETYRVSMVNNGSGNTYFLSTDENDNISRLNALLNGAGGSSFPATVMFDASQIIRSITIDDVSYVFNNNTETNKVDVNLINGANSQIFTGVADIASLLLPKSAPAMTKAAIDQEFMDKMSAAIGQMASMLGVVAKVNEIVVSEPNEFNTVVAKISGVVTSVTNDMTAYVSADVKIENVSEEEFKSVIKDLSESIPSLNILADKNISEIETAVQVEVAETDETATENTESGEGAIVSGNGKLKATLTWRYGADIDLHIFEPGFAGEDMTYYDVSGQGHIYYYAKTNTFTDGYLDYDNTVGYYINPQNPDETDPDKAAIENIYWETVNNGDYYVYLHYYAEHPNSWCDYVTTGPCTVSLFVDGVGKSTVVNMTSAYNNTMLYIGKVTFPGGIIDFAAPEPVQAKSMMMRYMLNPAKK